MGNNPFITHRIFVAALQGDGRAPTKPPTSSHADAGRQRTAGGGSSRVDADSHATTASQHWLDFPFARRLERSAS